VGYVNEISADLLALGLRTFKQRGHDIEIQLAEGTTGALLDALRNGRMDVVFVRSPIHRDDIHYEQLIEEHLVLVSPAGTRVDDRAASLGALREARWIVPSRDAARGLRDDIDRAFEGAGYRPIVVREAPTLTAVLLLVAGGIGCGLVPASVARLHPLPGVHHVRLDGPAPVTSAGMAWRNTDQSMALQHFLGAVRQTARDRSATPEE
jgi:DNA-binding transcriptional LysR family regulator